MEQPRATSIASDDREARKSAAELTTIIEGAKAAEEVSTGSIVCSWGASTYKQKAYQLFALNIPWSSSSAAESTDREAQIAATAVIEKDAPPYMFWDVSRLG